MEAQIRDIVEKRDYYRKERDYFQNVAFYNYILIESRPLRLGADAIVSIIEHY